MSSGYRRDWDLGELIQDIQSNKMKENIAALKV